MPFCFESTSHYKNLMKTSAHLYNSPLQLTMVEHGFHALLGASIYLRKLKLLITEKKHGIV